MSKPPLDPPPTGRGRREKPGSSVVGGLRKNRNPPSSSSLPTSPSSPPEPSTSSLAGEDAGASDVVDVDATVLERKGVGVVDVVVAVVVELMAAVLLLAADELELEAVVELPDIMDIKVVVVELAMLASICIRVLEVGTGVVVATLPAVAPTPAMSDWAGGLAAP